MPVGKYDGFLEVPHPIHGTVTNINPITGLPNVDAPERDVPFGEALTSGLILSNPISGAIDRGHIVAPSFKPVEGYDVTKDPALEGQDIMNFVGSRSPEQSQYMLQELERNAIHKQLSMYKGGGWGTMIGVLGDPLIMGGAIATAGSSMAVAAVTDVAMEVTREAILHSQQPLRTKMETAFNVATVGVVDAALWRLNKTAVGRAKQKILREKATTYMSDPKSTVKLDADGEEILTVAQHAAKYSDETAEETASWFTKKELQATADELGVPRSGNKATIAGRIKSMVDDIEAERAARASPTRVSDHGEKAVGGYVPGMRFSPGGRVMQSSTELAKKVLKLLVDVPYRMVQTEAGEAVVASVEAKIKKGFGDFASMTDVFTEQFKAYSKKTGVKFFGRAAAREDFLLEVHRTMESGAKHADSHVNRVAEYFKKYDDAYFEAEQALGIAGSRRRGGHVMRIYNDSKIKANLTGLTRTVAANLKRVVATAGSKRLLKYSDGSFEVVNLRHVSDAKTNDPNLTVLKMDDMTDAQFEAVANDMVGSLTTRTMVDDIEPDLVVVDPSSVKSRMFDFVPTKELEPWLETNALAIMGIRARQHYRSQAMREAFPDDPTMVTVFKQIAEEYQALREAPGVTQKEIARLNKEERAISGPGGVLQSLRDAVHGVYAVPDNPYSSLVRAGRFLRLGALTGYGANIASTSLTDFLTPALRNGLEPFGEGLKLLFKGAAKKEYLAEIRKMGVAVESVTNNKAAMLINMSHVTKNEQQFMKFYGKWTGLDWVTDTSQGLNAMSHLQTWKKWADNWDKIGDAKKKRLLDVGIDENMLMRIKDQWDTYGESIQGTRLPTTNNWTDIDAAAALENAVRKEVFMTTLVPGKGDIPLAMQTEPGKFAGMFMSFIAGAHQRLLVAGFQRNDAAFYTGILVSAASGMLVQAGKDIARGKDMSQRDPLEYAIDSIDKTGMLGWFSVPMQPVSSIAAGRPVEFVWRNLNDQTFSAPPIEWASDIAVPTGNILMGQGEGEDIVDLLKVTPFVNALHMVDLAERLHEHSQK